MVTPTPTEGLQRLAILSEKLEEVIEKRSLSDIFVKAVQPKEKQRFGHLLFTQVKQVLSRLISPNRHLLKTNLLECQKYFNAVHEVKVEEFGAVQKNYTADLQELINTFADRLDTIRTQAVSVLEDQAAKEKKPEKQKKIQEQIKSLLDIHFEKVTVEEKCANDLEKKLDVNRVADELFATTSLDARRERIAEVFEQAWGKTVPEGVRIKNPEALRKTFLQHVEKRRSEFIKKEIDNFETILDAKVQDLQERKPPLDLGAAMKEFYDFATENFPQGISLQEFTKHSAPRLKTLEKTMHQQLRARVEEYEEAVAQTREDIRKKLGGQKIEKMIFAGHYARFTAFRDEIKNSTDLNKSEKNHWEEEFDRYEHQLIEIQRENVTNETYIAQGGSATGTVVAGKHIVVNPPDADAVNKAASKALCESFIRTSAYIAYEAFMKGPSSVLSSAFLLSLAAPYLATYASNKLCAELPQGVAAYVKPFVTTFTTLTLVRCGVPYVDHMFHQIIPSGTQNVMYENEAQAVINGTLTRESNETQPEPVSEQHEALPFMANMNEARIAEGANQTQAVINATLEAGFNVTEPAVSGEPVTDIPAQAIPDISTAILPSLTFWQKVSGAWGTFLKAQEALREDNTHFPLPTYGSAPPALPKVEEMVNQVTNPAARRSL